MSYSNKEMKDYIKNLKGLVVEFDDQTRRKHLKFKLTMLNRSDEKVHLILIMGKTPSSDWKMVTDKTLRRMMRQNDIPLHILKGEKNGRNQTMQNH